MLRLTSVRNNKENCILNIYIVKFVYSDMWKFVFVLINFICVVNSSPYPQEKIDQLLDAQPKFKDFLKTNHRGYYNISETKTVKNNDTICPSNTTRQFFPRSPLELENGDKFIVINHGEYVQAFDKTECDSSHVGLFEELCSTNTGPALGCHTHYTTHTVWVLMENKIQQISLDIASGCVCGPSSDDYI